MNMNKFLTVIPSLILGVGLFAQSQWLSGADLISKIDWIKSESKAIEIGSQSNKPIMIDGWADWCAACKKMDNSTFRNQKS